MKRKIGIRTAIASVAFMVIFAVFGPGTAGAACGGCFCPGSGGPRAEGGYACVKVGDYHRWMPWA